MKILFALALLTFSLSGFSQKEIDSIKSKKLNEYRTFYISVPDSYYEKKDKKYPLLIVLDGDYLFEPFYGALNYGAYFDLFPETVIVGIHQNEREKRLDDSNYNPDDGLPAGKGAQFFEFVGGELLPYIERNYRIAPFKMIAGHDVTAGFLNFFLYKKDPLFDGYISLSPEFAPGMEIRVAEKMDVIDKPVFYYQSISTEDIAKIQHHVKLLDTNIKGNANPNLFYKLDEFKNTSHYSQVLTSVPSALCFFFKVYQPITSEEYERNIESLKSGHVDYLKNKYKTIYKTMGLKVPVRYNDFKAVEVAILKNQAYDELKELSALAKEEFPKTLLSQYVLALMYEKLGNAKKAVKLYQDASQLGEIGEHTKQNMLDKCDLMKTQLHK